MSDRKNDLQENSPRDRAATPRGLALGQAFAVLRYQEGLSTAELLRRARVKEETLAGYLRGERAPQAPQMARLSAALKEHPERVADLARLLGAVSGLQKTASLDPAVRALTLAWPLRQIFLDSARESALPQAPFNTVGVETGCDTVELVERLAKLTPGDRVHCLKGSRAFRGVAVVVALGERSTCMAANSTKEAEHWADLAWLAARLTPLPTRQRHRLLAEALAYQANAARVSSRLQRSSDLFEEGLLLRSESAPLPGLNEARFLDLLASLRRDQRALVESLSLLHRALASATPASIPRLLISRAKTYEELGRNEEAVADLRTAEALIDPEAEPRLAWVIRFNLLVNLCALDCTAEAEPLLPELRAKGQGFANGLDLLRLDWLEAKIDAGQGRRDKAIDRLDRVRRAFLEWKIVYDAALATLELAVFLLEAGRIQEVKDHARELGRTFKAQGVEREALASLLVYRQAAEQERLTLAALREVIAGWRGVGGA